MLQSPYFIVTLSNLTYYLYTIYTHCKITTYAQSTVQKHFVDDLSIWCKAFSHISCALHISKKGRRHAQNVDATECAENWSIINTMLCTKEKYVCIDEANCVLALRGPIIHMVIHYRNAIASCKRPGVFSKWLVRVLCKLLSDINIVSHYYNYLHWNCITATYCHICRYIFFSQQLPRHRIVSSLKMSELYYQQVAAEPHSSITGKSHARYDVLKHR